ncbi:GNAT family N-acetyltransferase [Hassallia byssoidea VB512170]|uniref:GNAT family N-acetyltransferase n=1 Tax=Hassallia byssoidea VB512170 TaxID=1304833 RepID=A0A846HEG4_9CYAN|nr:GNAT family N-acetyltransferase [Hassalia byssoidea]NEU75696.1 GNAT family N-acetyltransferase [Hassalia byssoidea VB512170]
MLIREAKLADANAIAKVHIDTWRTTYRHIMPEDFLANLSYEKRETGWAQILSNTVQDNFTYVVEDVGQIVGFANGGLEQTNDPIYKGELNAIYIVEKYQGQGIGHNLVSTIAARLVQLNVSSMLVWVLADNPACKFYESLGGQLVKEKLIERGKVEFVEVAYGWTNTRSLLINS